MGTKIQSIYIEGSTNENRGRPLYRENRNGHNPAFVLSPMHKNGDNMDKMRNTILEQESMFRHQLGEMHYLYRRQRELMNEMIQRKGTDRIGQSSFVLNPPREGNITWISSFAPQSSNVEHRSSNANLPLKGNIDLEIAAAKGKSFDVPIESRRKGNDLELNLLQFNGVEDRGVNRIQANGNLFQSSLGGFNSGIEYLSDDRGDNPMIFSRGPRMELLKSPIFEAGSSSRRKRKLFGVEIFEGNGEMPSSNPTTSLLNHNLGHCNERSDTSFAQKRAEGGGLPWFLRDSQQRRNEPSNAKTNSYFMNLDSLQNSSPNFFKKAEVSDGIQYSKQRIEIDNVGKAKDGDSGSRQYIDLNLSLDEQSDLWPPHLPTAIEASSAITDSSDANASSKEGKSKDEETDKIAVDALIAISSLTVKNSRPVVKDNDAGEPLESCLKWLANVFSTFYGDEKEESIPKGMDCFEYTTLNLEDAKDENYLYNPTLTPLTLQKKQNDDEIDENYITSATKRSRRRGSRPQRRDFQRDLLPSLVTLSRLQVAEDLQAFEELNKSERSWRKKSCARNGKVRKAVSSVQTQRFNDDGFEDGQQQGKGLTSWGKRTRRLPRRRCFAGLLSHAVKC